MPIQKYRHCPVCGGIELKVNHFTIECCICNHKSKTFDFEFYYDSIQDSLNNRMELTIKHLGLDKESGKMEEQFVYLGNKYDDNIQDYGKLIMNSADVKTAELKITPDTPKLQIETFDKSNKVHHHSMICRELNEIYEAKNADYGDSFGKSYTEYGITMSLIRLEDKLNRLKSLSKADAKVKDESIEDTLLDLANYAIMSLMEVRNK